MLIGLTGRIDSSRLPGKPILDLGNNCCSIKRIFESACEAGLKNKTFVLTTTLESDLKIVEFCKSKSINYYCGDPRFVLKRLINLAENYPEEEYIMYIGTDSPLVDVKFLRDIFAEINKKNLLKKDLLTCYFPNTFPGGYEFNIVSTKWLRNLNIKNLHYSELEHCFNKLLLGSDRKSVINIQANLDLSWLNFSLDNEKDLNYIRKLIKEGASNNLSSILKTIISDHELIKMTKSRIDKKVYNSFISSPGMHSSIEDKITSNVNQSFKYLQKKKFDEGIKIMLETKNIIDCFLNNEGIEQIHIRIEDIVNNKTTDDILNIFEEELFLNGFT